MKKMKRIFFFFWNVMTGIKRANMKLSDVVTAFLALIYSFESVHIIGKRSAIALPARQQQPYAKQQPSVPIQKDPQHNRHIEWQIWCENNRRLFQSSA
jgi:hypothetical protein